MQKPRFTIYTRDCTVTAYRLQYIRRADIGNFYVAYLNNDVVATIGANAVMCGVRIDFSGMFENNF
jgi:hypothetical protein